MVSPMSPAMARSERRSILRDLIEVSVEPGNTTLRCSSPTRCESKIGSDFDPS